MYYILINYTVSRRFCINVVDRCCGAGAAMQLIFTRIYEYSKHSTDVHGIRTCILILHQIDGNIRIIKYPKRELISINMLRARQTRV